jgi:phospholipid transport system substrate-binding protein
MYLDDVNFGPHLGPMDEVAERIAFMQRFQLRRRGIIAATAFLFLGAAIPTRASGEAAAVAPIQQLISGLIQIMKAGPATPFRRRFAMLTPVIDKTFDLEAILRESVGISWATLPPDQQAMLTDAFRRYTIASYVNSFDDYNGQRFEVSPETRAVGSQQVVETKVIPHKGDSHELDYVMREGPNGWRVVDVLADGSISRVAVQRSDFRSILSRGGSQALADSLHAKSTDLSDGSS